MAESEQAWWERTWKEREDLLARCYGRFGVPGHEGKVLAFSGELRLHFPGCCIYAFPPEVEGGSHAARTDGSLRDGWLYVTHGPSQPAKRPGRLAKLSAGPTPSGHGIELAVLVREPADWAPELLQNLLLYFARERHPIGEGHRIPFRFLDRAGELVPAIVGADGLKGEKVAGSAAALLIWPTLDPWMPFETSTGVFQVLVATPITQEEWDLAKSTSSTHLLALLYAKSGQEAVPLRESVTSDRKLMNALWPKLGKMSSDDVFEGLYSNFAKEREGFESS